MKRFIFLNAITASQLCLAQLPAHVSSGSLLGWYSFNGNANDASANNNHATVSGAVLASDQAGNASSAYQFSQNAKIKTPITPQPTTSKAIFVKFNANTVSSNLGGGSGSGLASCLVSSDSSGFGGFALGISNNKITALCGTTWTYASYTFQLSTWYHVGANYNASAHTVEFFVNGSSVATNTVSQFPNNHPTNFKIGYGMPNAWNSPFDGKIDEVGIWDRTLTICEIQQLYSEAMFGFATQPQSQTVTVGSSVQFASSGTNFPGAVYQWQLNAGTGFQNLSNAGQYSGVNTATLTVANLIAFNNNQLYRCLVTAVNCSAVSDTAILHITDDLTGIRKNEPSSSFSILVSPLGEFISLRSSGNQIQPLKLIITDVQGRCIYSGDLLSNDTVNTSSLSSGLYIITAGDQRLKFLKQ